MALIAYLLAEPLTLPSVVDTSRATATGGGTLTVSFDAGDLFLENAKGEAYRLSWTADDTERERHLPAGVYRVRTYRVLGVSDGQPWHISGTAPTIREIEVTAGRNVAVDIDQRITFKPRMRGKNVTTAIGGDKGVGLTIYRGQKRIDMGYRIRSADGEQLAAGSMRYG